MRKVLIISYYFPPVNGAGVHRPWAWARHLRQYGYEPIILTSGPQWHARPFARLEREEVRNCRVARTPDDLPSRMYAFLRNSFASRFTEIARILEPRGLWAFSAVAMARRILSSERIDVILTTAPPYAVSLVALYLRAVTGLPWVMDLQDPWAFGISWPWLLWGGYVLDRTLQSFSMFAADFIVLNTPTAYRETLQRSRHSALAKATCITNGFRPTYVQKFGESGKDCIRIVHVGAFYFNELLATRRSRLRARIARSLSYAGGEVDQSPQSAGFLLRALSRSFDKHPELRHVLKITLVGAVHPSCVELIDKLSLGSHVRLTGQLRWAEAARHIHRADALYLPFWRSMSKRSIPRVPSKTYEYIGSGKPIIGMVESGDTRDIIKKAGTAIIVPEMTLDSLADTLWKLYKSYRSGPIVVNPNWGYIDQFRWNALVQKLATVMDLAISRRTRQA